MKKWLIVSILSVLAHPVFAANWQVDNDLSSVSFISTKKGDIAEVHKFKQVSGTLDEQGKFSLTIDLASVDTGISIRDERMQGLLFEVAQYPTLTLSASVPPKLVNDLAVGSTTVADIEATIDLHGQQQKKVFKVLVAKLSDKKFMVTSLAPVVVQAQDFGLVAGVEKLRAIAGLSSISLAVPVSFVVGLHQ
ncbi:YceI family protein [Shewanella gaetbuli]|uniref:YceI family protein n=1 Tax=Shewanella gaetbuli TaxID=220752 RepID=A0A9X2CIH8_9GAMM|nr:YceI family protein [Shewanella gaetbuli]MCL1143042.1 YceI family protein [Shewanella gaetbuli]